MGNDVERPAHPTSLVDGPPARTLSPRLIGRLAGLATGLGLAILPGLALADPRSPFSPASPQAAAIANLFWFLLVIAGLIFVGVEGTILYSAFAHRERPGRVASQFSGNSKVEIAWTAIPAVILLIVFILTVRTMHAISTPSGDPLEITVIGHQFWWQFDYDQEKFVTANEIHVPVGQPVVLHLTSADVLHSFWVPQLAGKQDTIPGQTHDLTFTAARPGTYLGQCSEFCGLGHTFMAIRVVADPPDQYTAWVRAQQQPAARPANPLEVEGDLIFRGQTCGSCHTIVGTPASGVAGPNLTHVGSRATIGAGVLTNTNLHMQQWLEDPQAVKPGALMPDFKLSPDQVKALAAYLEGLR
ncbi:MAG: cytochrome c oxidase subunit II [Chloroflexota bacterium]